MVRQSSRALSYTVSCGLALTALLASSQIAPAVQISPVLASATDPRPDPASAQMHLERARALSLLGDFDAAQNEFAHVAKLQREIGVLPTEALWSIAEIYYGKGRDIQAAEVLVDLAGEAELRGDPVVQVKALMEAAVLYQTRGLHDDAGRLVKRLEQLRSSPYLTDELRAQVDARIPTSLQPGGMVVGPV